MSSFTDPSCAVEELDVTPLADGRTWRVVKEFDFASRTLERIVRVPVGQLTDFASVPRALWSFWPPTGKYTRAALVHDRLYREPSERCTRYQADRTLLEGCVVLGVSLWTCMVLFLGVRLGGRRAFQPRTKE